MGSRFRTFDEFWPVYVRTHSKRATRRFHFFGTSLTMLLVAVGVLSRQRWLTILGPVLGCVPAKLSHVLVEGEDLPIDRDRLWSLRADLRMWWKMLDGTMDDEVAAVAVVDAGRHASAGSVPAPNMRTDGTLN